jgi:hypothetical protein
MMDSGCYLSTDQGTSWKPLCSPPIVIDPLQRFYVKGNNIYIIADEDSVRLAPSLWMLDMDSLNTISANFAEQFPDGTKRTSVSAGSNVTVNYVPQTDTLVGIDSVMLAIHYDSASLSLTGIKIPSPWSILDSSLRGNELHILLTDTSAEPLPSPILQLQFGTFLTGESQAGSTGPRAKVYLDSAHLYGHRLNCDCAVQSILSADTASLASSIDSVEIDFTGCGDSLLIEAMQGQPLFSIVSIQPNPASGTTQINFINPQSSPISYEVIDALGATRLRGVTGGDALTLGVSPLAEGVYFFRAYTSEGISASRELLILK